MAVLVASATVACSRPVAVTVPEPPADVAGVCNRFIETLPEELPTVGDRRAVTDDSRLTAAYGDPPVAVRCGVPSPSALTPTSMLITVQGLDWFPEELSAGWRLTTVGLVADVELTVPSAHGPAPSVAADLQPALAATIPVAARGDAD